MKRRFFSVRYRYPAGRSTSRASLCTATTRTCSPYVHIDGVEQLQEYRPGGYHPVLVGNLFNDRYRIIDKLGYGTFSTTWLARDERRRTYVAVKIGMASTGAQEADVLTQLSRRGNQAQPSAQQIGHTSALIPSVLDRFIVDGPNGRHPCLVTALARCSLADAKEASGSRLFQLDVARSLAAQMALALAYVHSQGYIHGDLHLGNALLRLPKDIDASEEQFYEQFGRPQPESVRRMDRQPLPPGVPPFVYPSAWLGCASHALPLSEARMVLTDFGVAYRAKDEARVGYHAPRDVRPPESRFAPTVPQSFASDIWTLGCAIWEILGQRPLLDSFLFTDDDVTADQVDVMGPLPPEWWAAWGDERSTRFVANEQPREGRSVWSWEQRFEDGIQMPRRDRGWDTIGAAEQAALWSMLRGMLVFQPEDRLSADQVIDTAWMQRWALPAYDESTVNMNLRGHV
ncbi:Protein kinase-like domain protein [Niveomyces insectorum RCEF 264]|uniref:non-specific serine/threonine protein kinase n=1 Tax=Niveomyces insectorum RCEF 264 TaxID=1081102 RepID=A0A168ACX1_9HYPO|nr:Protein kinase-like domain protein [Niveomyces insectorum RCEF 264]